MKEKRTKIISRTTRERKGESRIQKRREGIKWSEINPKENERKLVTGGEKGVKG